MPPRPLRTVATALNKLVRRQVADADRPTLASRRQALLRLGAMAGSAPIQELFDAVTAEYSRIVDIESGESYRVMAGLSRFDPDGMMTTMAVHGPGMLPRPGSRWSLDGASANALVFRTGRPARIEGSIPVDGMISRQLNKMGAMSSIAVPIFVDNRLWGSATVMSDRPKPLPAYTEARLGEFAALAATAIWSAERRNEMLRLADEQAALGRVATLVATGAEPEQVWDSVMSELGELCHGSRAAVIRYDPPDAVTIVAVWAADGSVRDLPARWPLSDSALGDLLNGERPVVRIDDWSRVPGELARTLRERWPINTSVMAPVWVDGRLWGGVVVHSPTGEVLPPDTERHALDFAELVSTAMANATARAEIRRLAEDQAAVRRIATMVARQAPLPDIWQAVAEELVELLPVEDVVVCRYEGDDTATVVGRSGVLTDLHPVGLRGPVDGDTAAGQICRDRRTVRVDSYLDAASISGRAVYEAGVQSTVACPIFVGDRFWGWLSVISVQSGRVPEQVVQPIGKCVDLIATAIRNAETANDLRASRERIVTATDDARRRFERDLHDGAQQRLVTLALSVRMNEHMGTDELARTADELDAVLADLRDLSRGLHPEVLSEGSLPTAMRTLAGRSSVPVRLSLPEQWPEVGEAIEIACYYVAAEALTNVAKHARANRVDVTVVVTDAGVRMTISDDGVGGVGTAAGSGLVGIAGRVEALGGSLSMLSPQDAGTTLDVLLPFSP